MKALAIEETAANGNESYRKLAQLAWLALAKWQLIIKCNGNQLKINNNGVINMA